MSHHDLTKYGKVSKVNLLAFLFNKHAAQKYNI